MRWYYKLLETGERFYIYAYSRESKDFDGIIRYDVETESPVMVKPSEMDINSELSQEIALSHFWKVINNDFPKECSVCCG